MVERGQASWASLPTALQEEMEDVLAMLTKAAGAYRRDGASTSDSCCRRTVRQDIDGAVAAYRAAIAADPGYADAHNNLGHLLQLERKDFDGSEAAYRAAIAADPGHALAHINLGTLLVSERKDFNGAEVAFHAAIAADPGHAGAHSNLGKLLQED